MTKEKNMDIHKTLPGILRNRSQISQSLGSLPYTFFARECSPEGPVLKLEATRSPSEGHREVVNASTLALTGKS